MVEVASREAETRPPPADRPGRRGRRRSRWSWRRRSGPSSTGTAARPASPAGPGQARAGRPASRSDRCRRTAIVPVERPAPRPVAVRRGAFAAQRPGRRGHRSTPGRRPCRPAGANHRRRSGRWTGRSPRRAARPTSEPSASSIRTMRRTAVASSARTAWSSGLSVTMIGRVEPAAEGGAARGRHRIRSNGAGGVTVVARILPPRGSLVTPLARSRPTTAGWSAARRRDSSGSARVPARPRPRCRGRSGRRPGRRASISSGAEQRGPFRRKRGRVTWPGRVVPRELTTIVPSERVQRARPAVMPVKIWMSHAVQRFVR